MTGLLGRLLHEFALYADLGEIVLSGLISLTFTPMMCARFLRHEKAGERPNRFFRVLEAGFTAMLGAYDRALRWVLRHETMMLGVTLATMVATVGLYVIVPKDFLPIQDTGSMTATIEGAQDISFKAFSEKILRVTDIVLRDPAIQSVVCFVSGGSNNGRMFLELKPLEERKVDILTVIGRLRRVLGQVQGVNLFMQPSQDIRVGARQAKSTYQYTLQGANLDELARYSGSLVGELKRVPQFLDVTSDWQSAGLQAKIVVDRAAAARLGLTLAAIDGTLYDAFGQRQVSTIYTTITQHHVVLEASPRYQADPQSLAAIYVKSAAGRMVPLGAVAHIERTDTALSVNHQGQFPAVTVSFNLQPGYSLGLATAAIERAGVALRIPEGIRGSFQGTAKVFQESLAAEPVLILAAIVAVYIILGMLYESLIHPLTILSTLPSAGVGALVALLLTGYSLTIVALIGIVLLIGIVKKNAIMMIDFALEVQRKEQLAPQEAIYRACIVRFRPIMMTTMAALFGALPLALEGGVGSELHKPLGISIIGGLIFSQALTLFTTPVIYVTLDKLRLRFRRVRPAAAGVAVPLPAGAG